MRWCAIGTDSDYKFNAIKPNETISTTNITIALSMLLLLSNSYLFNPNEKKKRLGSRPSTLQRVASFWTSPRGV